MDLNFFFFTLNSSNRPEKKTLPKLIIEGGNLDEGSQKLLDFDAL